MGSNVMDGSGFYNEHSVQQEEAAAAGVEMLQRAAGEIALPDHGPVVVADYGASQGKNSLHPLRVALGGIRARHDGAAPALLVVHTDLPENDFSSLFETVEHDPETYAGDGVFTFAAGRSFYEPLFPDGTVALGWSATAVVWLSRAPCPLPNHLFSFAAIGDERKVWDDAAAADWETFLRLRAAEFQSGGEFVVTTLVSGSGYLDWMSVIEQGARDTLDAGVIGRDEYEAMVIPTYVREPDELFGAAARAGMPLAVAESQVAVASDPAFDAFERDGDVARYAKDAVAAYRAWSEPALMSGLDGGRTLDERAAVADALYEHTRARLEATPTACAWHIGLVRFRRH